MADGPVTELPTTKQPEKPAAPKPSEVKAPEKPIGQDEQEIIERINRDGDPDTVLQDIAKEGEPSKPLSTGGDNLKSDDLKSAPLGFKRKDVSGMVQKVRQKRNIEYQSPTGERFFVKYATRQEGHRDNLEGLKHEKKILDKLASTGVVPITGELKIYPNGNKARLIMELVTGNSLDSEILREEGGYGKQHPQDVILSTAQAHNRILEMGIVVVDVNEGTYMLQQDQNGLSTKIVDFELSCELSNPAGDELQKALDWYRAKDFGLRISGVESISAENADVLKQSDVHLWAKTIAEWLLGPSYSWQDVTISPEKQSQYQAAVGQVKPVVDGEITRRAKEDFQKMIARGGQEWKGCEQAYIEYEIEHTSPYKLREVLIGLTFEEMIKAKGIQLPQATIDFISKALSYDIRERPTSFDDLIPKK